MSLAALPQGAFRNQNGDCVWRVWAPQQSAVHLVLWNGESRSEVPMTAVDYGCFEHRASGVSVGQRYAYRLPNADFDLPDPASRWQPDGVHRPSAVWSPADFSWTDAGWQGVSPRDLVIYEMHVGTFTKEGTFDAVIPRLESLRDLGITAIELLPVSQFPGNRNWGYDGVHHYAAQNTYGGPQGLQRLVDAAHSVGLGVILDVVYNHFGPEGNYLGFFGPYFTDRYHTPWGSAVNFDGPDSDPVRQFVIDNACWWIRDFHIDGLRLDAVQAIYDFSAYHLLAELQEHVQTIARSAGRDVVVIAETDQNDARQIQPRTVGGFDLDGVWADDFHHVVHRLVTGQSDGYYRDYGDPHAIAKALNDGFVYDGNFSEYRRRRHGSSASSLPKSKFVFCIQNHDQVGNRPIGDRLATLTSPEQCRLAAALLLLSPATPMLFMGEEYGETRPFPFFCSFLDQQLIENVRKGRRAEFAALAFEWGQTVPDPQAEETFHSAILSWDWNSDAGRSSLRKLYQDLLQARKSWPELHSTSTRATLHDDGLLELIRGSEASLTVWANLTDQPIAAPTSSLADAGFSTAAKCYGGERDLGQPIESLQPWELVIAGLGENRRSTQ